MQNKVQPCHPNFKDKSENTYRVHCDTDNTVNTLGHLFVTNHTRTHHSDALTQTLTQRCTFERILSQLQSNPPHDSRNAPKRMRKTVIEVRGHC